MPAKWNSFPRLIALAFVVLAWPSLASAQTTFFVKDINTSPGGIFQELDDYVWTQFVSMNGVLFFNAADQYSGKELWKSDGNTVSMVADIHVGLGDSGPRELTVVNGTLYFVAGNPLVGEELWKSDGTAAGTTLVKDIVPGTTGSSPTYLKNLNGVLYFAAVDPVAGNELWKSDGTSAGTVVVKDIASGAASSTPQYLIISGNALYFMANDGTNGVELWKSDGSSAGTVMVKDLNPGSGSSFASGAFYDWGGVLYGALSNGIDGLELWSSDGTSAGTVMVKDINPGPAASAPGGLIELNGALYFRATSSAAGAELWKTDGTNAGTVMVKDINPGFGPSSIGRMAVLNGVLYFPANNGFGGSGTELWKSDGTAVGTVLVKDVFPGTSSSTPSELTNVNGVLYFNANDGGVGRELWTSDGTTSGTVLLKDIAPGTAESWPGFFTEMNGTTCFLAQEPDSPDQWTLWKSDGTSVGTVEIGISLDSNPNNLTGVDGGSVFFTADDGTTGVELWKSDGTAAGTVLVKDIFPGVSNSSPFPMANIRGTLYFAATDAATGRELWRSDGTTSGTVLVKDIWPGGDSYPTGFTYLNGLVCFVANNGTHGYELWKSDGTAAGTVLLKDINAGAAHSQPNYFVSIGNLLYFSADNGIHGVELWRSDGTTPGTFMVADLSPGALGSAPVRLFEMNGTLYFGASNGTSGHELWKYHPDTGLVLVKDINGGSAGSLPMNFTKVNGILYFTADDGVNGQELWKSDGTGAGTVMVKNIRSGSAASAPGWLTEVNGTLYFSADDGIIGRELWKSDGTAGGTVLVKEIWAGPYGGEPALLVNGNGTLFFEAGDGAVHSIWKSDGTPSGTIVVPGELTPGTFVPNHLTLQCPYLLFSGLDSGKGYELFAIQLSGSPGFSDLDEDGYGSGNASPLCAGMSDLVASNTDCNDGDPSIHPGTVESLCDGIDANCNGSDEGVCLCYQNAPGLAGWWRGNGTPDDIVGGNNGTLSGVATYGAGRVGQAFDLTSSGTLAFVANLGDAQSYSFIENTGVFTINAWINLTNVNFTGTFAITANAQTSVQKGHLFVWDNPGGEHRLRFMLSDGSGTPIIDSLTPNHVITTAGWHHVAVVGDGTHITFYVDGVSFPGTGTMGLKPSGPSIRAVDMGLCGSGCPFDGRIDELQIHDLPLTASQIQAIYGAADKGMCGTGCEQNPGGLVGWWPGNKDTGDRSWSNNNGTPTNVTYVPGKVGYAFHFSGGNFVEVPDAPSLEVTTQLTVATWIRPDATNNSARILSRGGTAYELRFSNDNGLHIRGDILSQDATTSDVLIAPGSLTIGQWAHVAMTFNSGVWKLFVNGVVVASKTSTITSIYSQGNSSLGIGHFPLPTGGANLNGAIDEAMVLNRALTDPLIMTLYDAGTEGLCGLGVVAVENEPPVRVTSLVLAQPWPNPTTSSAIISFQLPTARHVKAEVYDLAGRRVASLLDNALLSEGAHRLTWGGRDDSQIDVAPGIYFVRVVAGEETAVRKLVMMR